MKGREPKLIVAIGRKGVGKTYATLEMIQKVLRGNRALGIAPRKVLLLDTNNEFSNVQADQNKDFVNIRAISLKDIRRFTMSNKIDCRRVSVFKDNGKKMNLKELQEALNIILDNFENGLLLIEDINKFVSDSLPNDLVGSIVTQRHVSVDVVLHFQSVGKVGHPKIWGNCNMLRFHKCDDTVKRHKGKFSSSLTHLYILEKMVDIEFEKGNKRFYAFLDKDSGKIVGDYTIKQFTMAIYRYLEDNYSTVFKPLLNKVDLLTSKKLYDSPKDLTKKLILEYTKKYCDKV